MIECDENGFYEVEGREYISAPSSPSSPSFRELGITVEPSATTKDTVLMLVRIIFSIWLFGVVPMLTVFWLLNHLFMALGLNWRV